MKLNLLFFASLRESVGTGVEQVDAPDSVQTAGQLRSWLAQRGDQWQATLGPERPVRIAVNHALAQADTALTDGAEVAFFPPVTGG